MGGAFMRIRLTNDQLALLQCARGEQRVFYKTKSNLTQLNVWHRRTIDALAARGYLMGDSINGFLVTPEGELAMVAAMGG